MKGKLTAKLNGHTRTISVWGVDSLQLTIDAINKIMTKAYNSEIWAKGEITLKDEQGEILQTMDAKK